MQSPVHGIHIGHDMTSCNLTPPCAECSLRQLAASTPLPAAPNALMGQASAVFGHVESERSEPSGCPVCDDDGVDAGRCWRDGCAKCCWCGLQLTETTPVPLADDGVLGPPSTPTDLLTMHLRAMCAVVRSLAGYLPYEQQVQLWAAEEACRG